jgi:Ser/Thr protein kinase RdoA (MazF antagonist)
VQTPGPANRDARRAEPERGSSGTALATRRPTDLRHHRSWPARDPAEALTRRLAQLGDLDYVRTVLQHAFEQFAPHAFEVEGFAIDHCKLTPWENVSLALSLALRSNATGTRLRQIVSGTVYSSIDAARHHWRQESQGGPPIGPHSGNGLALASMALVPEMAMVLRVFPYDPGLTGLARATDRTTMTALLATHLPECRDHGWRIGDLALEPIQYKPGRLCTLRYTVILLHPRHTDSKRVDVFGKVYCNERWRRSYALLEATWHASLRSSGVWCAAQPIAAVGSWRLIVQRAVAGQPFRRMLGDLTKDDAPAEITRAERHFDAVARAVRSMQQSRIRLGSCLDFSALAACQRANLDPLRRVHGDLAGEVHRLRTEIERLASSCPASELALAHGDFAYGNVIIDGERVGIIDFDRAGQAEPAYDGAYFLTHLASFSLRHPERAALIRSLCDYFREAYLGLAPQVSSRRLALYEALDLSAYVLRNFRKRSHQPEWLGWARGQIESAWERLGHAAAEGRSAS